MSMKLFQAALCFTGAWRNRVKCRASSAVVGILVGALGLSIAPAAHSQYTTNFQDTIISGVTSNWSGGYIVGSNTFADVLFVQSGGLLADENGYLGYEVNGSNNVAAVIGPGSVWSNSGSLYIGNSGADNFLWIADGGAVVVSNSFVGYIGTNNEVLVEGSGSVWSNGGDLVLGYYGSSNTLAITGGGAVYDSSGCIGCETTSLTFLGGNAALVTGTGSVWSNLNAIGIGYENFDNSGLNVGNTLMISAGGAVYCAGGGVTGPNSAVVTGNGSVWSSSGGLTFRSGTSFFGGDSFDLLTIADGGAVYNAGGYVGGGAVLVTGTGSVWSNSGELFIEGDNLHAGNGSMIISNGGAVYSGGGEVASFDQYILPVVVTGTGSVWNIENDLNFEGFYSSMAISDGGAVYCGSADFDEYGDVQVAGAGSVWYIENSVSIARFTGLIIFDGGAVYSGSGVLTFDDYVQVTGTGSVWSIGSGLDIDPGGYLGADLLISYGGAVSAANVSSAGDDSDLNVSGGILYVTNGLGTGVLQIDAGALSIDSGTVTADQLVLSDDDGASTFSFMSGLVNSGGTFVTNGQDFVVGDGTDVATFHLAGGFHSFANGLLVDTNSSVTGCGTLDGSVVIDPDATVLANCGGTLTFTGIVTNNGTLRAINGSILEFYGPVVNNGLIDITGGTTNFHNTFVNNGSIISAASPFRITSIAKQANNILITWMSSPGQTNELQVTPGGTGGTYTTNNFTPIFTVTNTVGSVTNYLDIGAATNSPARYYRVRLVP